MSPVKQPELDRQARRLALPGGRFAAVAAVLAIPGIVLIIVGSGAAWAAGIGLLAVALAPAAVSLGLVGSAAVARWASRERPFA